MATRRRRRPEDRLGDEDLFRERPGNGAPDDSWLDEFDSGNGHDDGGNGNGARRKVGDPLGLGENGSNGADTTSQPLFGRPMEKLRELRTGTHKLLERTKTTTSHPKTKTKTKTKGPAPRTKSSRSARTKRAKPPRTRRSRGAPEGGPEALLAPTPSRTGRLSDLGRNGLSALRDLREDGMRRLRKGNGEPPLKIGPGLPPADGTPPKRNKPRLKKLRVALVLFGLALLALVSWIFGIMMSVTQDLPQLQNREQFKHAQNSVVLDRTGAKLATLTGNQHRILVSSGDISQTVKQAVISIEDQRFYQHRGVDYQGILRAIGQDVLHQGSVQGASTITQQFVKNALKAQASRTVFEKLREAALAYQLERHWTKDKILTEYLNSIYFGEGAYGIESAAQTYFGWNHPGCGDPGNRCASQLYPEEAALLAGMISSPSGYSPRNFPTAAKARRNLVLQKMVEQGSLSADEAATAEAKPLPKPSQIHSPTDNSEAPYFTDWLKQQLVDRYGAGEAFGGGLRVKSTLDLEFQRAAEDDVYGTVSPLGLSGSAVVIDNKTGGVLAMVGGSDYQSKPFNLATNGHRQPGSSFKPFTLVTALEKGHSPDETFTSQPKTFQFHVKGYKKPQQFYVHNYNDEYGGVRSIATATTFSDNSVYAELGLQLGTTAIAHTAKAMGIQTKVSTNPAMILGGLEEGVTPLEMAYAYTTLARHGARVGGSMDSVPGPGLGPVGISQVTDPNGNLVKDETGASGRDEVRNAQVVPRGYADEAVGILRTVVTEGTGKRADIGGDVWGKTGTTENNGDAWFCGANTAVTACVWVGHADSNKPMETEFGGQPVDGGTLPAEIWASIVSDYESIVPGQGKATSTSTTTSTSTAAPTTSAPTSSAAPAPTAAPAAPATPAPAAPAPTGGGGATGGAGVAPKR